MTSSDLIILEAIKGLENKIVVLQQDMNQMLVDFSHEFKETRQELLTEIKMNTVKIDAVHDKVNWGFSLTTVFIGIVGGIALLHPAIKALSDVFADRKKNYMTDEQVKKLIEEHNERLNQASNLAS